MSPTAGSMRQTLRPDEAGSIGVQCCQQCSQTVATGTTDSRRDAAMPIDAKELAEIVATAKEATEDLENADLRRSAFERVLDHLLKNGGPSPPASPTGASDAPSAVSPTASTADSVFADVQQRADAIANYFQINSDDVEHVFDVSGEELLLNVYGSRLDSSNAVATRTIALLVTGAQTALARETTTEHIRGIAESFGRLDRSNFMATLGKMPEISVLGRRGSPNRVVRMKVSGAEKARELVQDLVSG